jgi:hypothetical protein
MEAFQRKICTAAYSVQAATQQQLTRDAVDAEARLLLASNVTVPFNGFVFSKRITKYPWRKITLAVSGYNDKPCGPIVSCLEQQQQCCLVQQSAILAIDPIEQHCQKSFSFANH